MMRQLLFSLLGFLLIIVPVNAYTIQSGDVAWKIADENDLSLFELQELNPSQDLNWIYTGDYLDVGGLNDGELIGANPVTATDWYLAQRLESTDTTLYLTNVNDLRDNAVATSSLPTKVYFMIEAENIDNAEIAVCPKSGYDQTNKKFTGCTRGLAFSGSAETKVTANAKVHPSGATANMTNVGQFYNLFGGIYDNNNWLGLNNFSSTTDSTTQEIHLGTSTPSYFQNLNGVLYYCNDGASCATIGAGANTYNFVQPITTSGNDVKIATSTYVFNMDSSSLLNVATTSGSGMYDFWNDRYNATTTKADYFSFSNDLSIGGNTTTTNATTTGSLNVGGEFGFGADTINYFSFSTASSSVATTFIQSNDELVISSTTVPALRMGERDTLIVKSVFKWNYDSTGAIIFLRKDSITGPVLCQFALPALDDNLIVMEIFVAGDGSQTAGQNVYGYLLGAVTSVSCGINGVDIDFTTDTDFVLSVDNNNQATEFYVKKWNIEKDTN